MSEDDVRREVEPLDYSPSSGAVDPEHAAQDESTATRTGRHAYTENATFAAEDMEASSDRWDTLNEVNRQTVREDGKNRRSEQHKQDHANDTQAWGRRIGLTDHEIETAITLVHHASREAMNQHGSVPMILAALTIAANKAPEHHPSQQKAIRPETAFSDQTPDLRDNYATLRDDLDANRRHVKMCREHLRQYL